MNSKSNYNNDTMSAHHPVPGPAILRGATGGIGPLPVINTVLSNTIPVTSVTIDTTNMVNPSLQLAFAAQISLPAAISVTLNFIVTKSCNGGAPVQIGGTYTFSTLVNILESEAFSFLYFESEAYPGICTYTVNLSTTSIIDITPGLTITNATITALAVDNL